MSVDLGRESLQLAFAVLAAAVADDEGAIRVLLVEADLVTTKLAMRLLARDGGVRARVRRGSGAARWPDSAPTARHGA